MTKGTKIALAVFAVVIGVLVFYYGIWGDAQPALSESVVPNDKSKEPSAFKPEIGSQPKRETPADQPRRPANSPPPAATNGGLLSESLDSLGNAAGRTASGITPEPSGSNGSSIGGTATPPLNATNSAPLGGDAPKAADAASAATQPGMGSGTSDDGKGDPIPAKPPMDSTVKKDTPTIEPTAPKPESTAGKPQSTGSSPSESGNSPRKPAPPKYVVYTVKQNDTMGSIAKEWFGDQTKWSYISQANPLADPTRLKIGQKLNLPPKDYNPQDDLSQVAPGAAGSAAYVVRSGDTLRKIAKYCYGDPEKWRVIYDANRKTIGQDPGDLEVGMKLSIPPASAAKKTTA